MCKHSKSGIYILLILFGFLSGCSSDGGSSNPTPTPSVAVKVSISGTVLSSDVSQTPLAEANVSIGTKTTQTDVNGGFLLEDISATSNSDVLVSFSLSGYASNQRYVAIGDSTMAKNYSINATLSVYQSSSMVDPAILNQVAVMDPANLESAPLASISFPANSIGAVNNVEVNVIVGDPSSKTGQAMFPGDYRAMNSGETTADTQLESVAFLDITVMDQGQKLTTLSTPADVMVKLPDMYQAGGTMAGTYDPNDPAKNSIEWWSYDDTKGAWMREDANPATAEIDNAAVVADANGVLYAQAKVTHFSWWNADQPITQHACGCVTVVDENGAPVVGARVSAQGLTYNGTSSPALSDQSGKACVNVKRSLDALNPEKFQLSVSNGGFSFTYDVTDAAEGDVATDALFSPTAQGSTLDNSGQCKNLANNLMMSFGGTITGTVTYEGGTPVPNQIVYSSYGPTATTNASGVYTLSAPINAPVNISVVGIASQRVTVPDASPFTVNFVIANQAPVINSLIRNPTGIVKENSVVTLTVSASDPEGQPVTYTWSTATGSLNTTTGSSVQWTAPAGQGTAVISVTASDGLNETTDTVSILYDPVTTGGGGGPASGVLKFTFKDYVRSNTPVAGVVMALYNSDNKTIKSTKTSGADGIVDFGQINTRVTITIAYTDTVYQGRYIDTFVDVIPTTMVYYTDGNNGTDSNNCNIPLGTGVLNVTGFVSGTTSTELQPMYDVASVDATGNATFSNLVYCDTEVQDDGTISLLTLGQDTQSVATSYGYVLNQSLNSATPYAITAAMPFTAYAYNLPAGSTTNYFDIEGYRKGVTYQITDRIGLGSTVSSSGVIYLANGFPVDIYYYWANSSVTNQSGFDNYKFVGRQSPTLPTTITPPFGDVVLTASTYNSATKTFSWASSGTGSNDFYELFLHRNKVAAATTFDIEHWEITLPPTSSGFMLPELPAPANTWVSVSNLDPADVCANAEVLDIDLAANYDDIINLLSGDTNFDALTFLYTGAFKTVDGTCITPTPVAVVQQVQSVTTEAVAPASNSVDRLKRKFSRF